MQAVHGVLITQCLQRDFVAPIARHAVTPNRLHVGSVEAERLVGVDPATGPVAQVLAWARALPMAGFDILHIVDAHDPQDPAQAAHLALFGAHCLIGSQGAELVVPVEGEARENERFVAATGLNDFETTTLPAELERIRQRAGGRPLRVGVIGVWTDAKVSFLCYDLITRGGVSAVATCSALTASHGRLVHLAALDQLERLLGVTRFDSHGDFAAWLAPDAAGPPRLAAPRIDGGVRIEGVTGLDDDARAVLGHLFREARTVSLHPLSGGFSGAAVYRAESMDSAGHLEAPSVVKLGKPSMIGKERVAFERVEAVLGNAAPRVQGFVDVGDRAGIRYSFAAMGAGRVRTLKSMFEDGAPVETLLDVLRTVTDEIFAPFFAAARYERLPLFVHYGFAEAGPGGTGPAFVPVTRHAATVRKWVEAVLGAPATDRTPWVGGGSSASLCRFYEEVLPNVRFPVADAHYVATVHGDLNGANILVDKRENVWVIDYFHTGPGHVWRDLLKPENDLLYLFTPLEDDDALVEAMQITRALAAVQDLRAPLPEVLPGLQRPALCRAWTVLRGLRAVGARVTAEDRHPWQVAIGLLRYAAHTLSFDEADARQKRWALQAAGVWAEAVERFLHDERTLRPGWVVLDGCDLPGTAGLAVVPCPGRSDRERDLGEDLGVLARADVTTLVGWITEPELVRVGAASLPSAAAAAGLRYERASVPDQQVPSEDEAEHAVRGILDALRRGERVAVHCLGGLGRSGTLAACVLVRCGMSADEAIRRVREARGPRAVETVAQEAFVQQFATPKA